jgi:hypothetical protein
VKKSASYLKKMYKYSNRTKGDKKEKTYYRPKRRRTTSLGRFPSPPSRSPVVVVVLMLSLLKWAAVEKRVSHI